MKSVIYTKKHKRIIKRLIQARKKSGLTQKEVAKKLGRSQSYVSKIESGQRIIDVIELEKFAEIYKKKIDHFI
ncbi:helix-turn-helix transcriptional regulator [Patescibacteria group bacterium]|nr:helix-turn-helix transcriptional regulator [Patescibacteria group bacterium]